jgi:4-hydroxybenzoate polyprenyltransferase
MSTIAARLPLYAKLMRFDRPVGSLLLLWPTLAALWVASSGKPSASLLAIFTLGTFVMRAAGCVINDWADRRLDGLVERTQERPLATGSLNAVEALVLFCALLSFGFLLVLLLNRLTQWMAVAGAAIATIYPFMKRWTYVPQVVLGAAFSWGLVMAFTAVDGRIPMQAWLLFLASVLWIVMYDTLYAMVDRDDDLKVGIKSTAILFGTSDRFMIGVLQALAWISLALFGIGERYGYAYAAGLGAIAALFLYQQTLIRSRARDACFKAFCNNVWVGFALWAAIVVELDVVPWLRSAL